MQGKHKYKISKCDKPKAWVVHRTVDKHVEFAVLHSLQEAQRMKAELEAKESNRRK